MPDNLTPIQYIRKNTSLEGESSSDFMKQWSQLTQEDKDDLKECAKKEMEA